MARDLKCFIVTVKITVAQQWAQSASITQEESVDIAVEDFPGMARILQQFHRAVMAVRKIGKVSQ